MASAAPFSGSLLCLTKPGTPQPPCFSPPPSRSHFHLRTRPPKAKRPVAGAIASSSMAAAQPQTRDGQQQGAEEAMKLLFVEMGVGYDQHGQDITSAAVRACKDAISSNSIPAFRRGSIPGVNSEQMKLQIKLGVPRPVQHLLDFERIKAVFPYGEITSCEVVDGGMICSSGTCIEAMGDKNDDCYIVNAAVYVGY
ncbi:hypothetical protein CFC21_097863 [Triticum aestivum]|uniref:Uncharacterized protein n=7 Tax=Triticum TaxID=4564 RepID=A0A9R0VJU6_TRITD|nr:uncharacterized protein LOC123061470 [Triticum aestivum]XP_048563749.1 uncharacterized protein LOC125544200 [Triticum urartu]KAF7095770.1 hypothetical protein CFC21_097863 [Triticum aestivum]VAH61676.1 unnamed protein product [Triticum turgidum subsp. durum]